MIGSWLKKRQEEREKKTIVLLESQLRDPNTKIGAYTLRFASAMAHGMVMKWLDDRRIRRCVHCSITAPLRSVDKQYYCEAHVPKEAVAA